MHTLAMSWDNYGMILYYSADESKEQEAGQWFEKAIRQKKELVSKDYLTYAPSLAQSYFHYARLLSKDKEKMQLAKSCLEKAIEIQEAREKDNQGYLTQDLAESYHVLAVVLQEINPGDAEKAYKYAKKHGGILFKRCAYYKSEYVSILENYSSFLKQQSDNSATYEEIIAEITEVKGED